MSQRFIVEFTGQAYGILERVGETLVFHATHPLVMYLDGQEYEDLWTGLRAVEETARGQAA